MDIPQQDFPESQTEKEWDEQELSHNTPCIRHTYKTVGNAYKNGKPSPHSFVDVEWKVEKVCTKCTATLPELVKQK